MTSASCLQFISATFEPAVLGDFLSSLFISKKWNNCVLFVKEVEYAQTISIGVCFRWTALPPRKHSILSVCFFSIKKWRLTLMTDTMVTVCQQRPLANWQIESQKVCGKTLNHSCREKANVLQLKWRGRRCRLEEIFLAVQSDTFSLCTWSAHATASKLVT